jgi:hypothetical protein
MVVVLELSSFVQYNFGETTTAGLSILGLFNSAAVLNLIETY